MLCRRRAFASAAREVVDDDYGMVKAVDYLRQGPGGDQVPVAVALTKCDEHVGLVRSAGGARAFIESRIPNLIQYGGRMRMFATAAVRTRSDAIGRPVPNTQHEPAGLSDALKYCMKHVGAAMARVDVERAEAARVEHIRQAARRDRQLAQQSYRKWIGFWIAMGIFGIVVVAVAMIATFWEQAPIRPPAAPPAVEESIPSPPPPPQLTAPDAPAGDDPPPPKAGRTKPKPQDGSQP